MSTRERWIVYPLLFLTLGIAMRDYFLPTKHLAVMNLAADEIHAKEINAQRVRCGESMAEKTRCNFLDSGRMECREWVVVGPEGRPAVVAAADPKSHNGRITTFSAEGRPLVQIRSIDADGIVATFSKSGRVYIMGEAGQRPSSRGVPEPRPQEKPEETDNIEQPAENLAP